MVTVSVDYTVTGGCTAAVVTLAVDSNQEGRDDYLVIDAHHVRLRAERAGKGARVYTITISATNDKNTFVKRALTVKVPHDQGKGK
jgi:hypothetical protein